MKKFLPFLGGLVTGVVLTIVVLLLIAKSFNSSPNTISGLTLFDEPEQIMEAQSYQVFQVVEGGNALANGLSNAEYGWYHGITVLLLADEDTHYYDEKEVKAPRGKCFRQVGTYQYQTKSEMWKTIPVVALCDK